MTTKHQEYQYLNTLQKTLHHGTEHRNRTGVTTRRLLCEIMKFDLTKEFPLLTTKKVYWKGVVHELLWFLSGSTSIKYLQDNNVHIWDANAEDFHKRTNEEREKLVNECNLLNKIFADNKNDEKNGEEMFRDMMPFFDPDDYREVGPVYGYQWRNFNGRPMQKGLDQISWAIDQIKNNPESRRIIVSAWNPIDIPHMVLPPCHTLFQLSVDRDFLHCTMYQRSSDLFLGVPFNIASYALLTCMIAHVCDLKPGTLNHILNDCHIYENHIEQTIEQLKREPRPFPTIELNPDIKNIFDFKYEDIVLKNYECHPPIKAEMAV